MATKPAGPRLNDPIEDASTLPVPKRLLLGLQHLFTMFGSTVLVPLLEPFGAAGDAALSALVLGSIGLGALFCLPPVLAEMCWLPPVQWEPAVIIGVLYAGVGCSFCSFFDLSFRFWFFQFNPFTFWISHHYRSFTHFP